MTKKKVLYITYDGITDPLGQSQILPYLKGLSEYGYQFTILSFEKKDRFQKQEKTIRALMAPSGIEWVPLSFSTKPPLLSKFYDSIRMRQKAISLHKKVKFDMIHCRSYIAADIGLSLKKRFGVKFFFDMRGFWADEKKDGGSWNVDHPIYKRVYQYYKRKEGEYLQSADCIVTLTLAAKQEMERWPHFKTDTYLTVIPCCSDMDHFSITDSFQKAEAKSKLGLSTSSLVLSYLGSIGTWYMLKEMILFFKQLKQRYSEAKFLILTHSNTDLLIHEIEKSALNKDDFIIRSATRQEVPALIKASDINLSFIKPAYSKISSSPTKLGEVLSTGIPVICNSGVGDVEVIINQTKGGYLIHDFTEMDFKLAIEAIPGLLNLSPSSIRERSADFYDLKVGVQKYYEAYQKVLG